MLKNNFPSSFVDRCIKLFLDRLFSKKQVVFTVPKKVINISLPFMGSDSLKIRSQLNKIVKTYFPACKLQVLFNSNCRLGSFFRFKDKVSLNARSLIIINFRVADATPLIQVRRNDIFQCGCLNTWEFHWLLGEITHLIRGMQTIPRFLIILIIITVTPTLIISVLLVVHVMTMHYVSKKAYLYNYIIMTLIKM